MKLFEIISLYNLVKTKQILTGFVKTGQSSFQSDSLMCLSFLHLPQLLLIDQHQPHLFIAQQRLSIRPPPRDDFKISFFFLHCGPNSPGYFSCLSCSTQCLCCSQELTSARLISAWQLRGPAATNTHTAG